MSSLSTEKSSVMKDYFLIGCGESQNIHMLFDKNVKM